MYRAKVQSPIGDILIEGDDYGTHHVAGHPAELRRQPEVDGDLGARVALEPHADRALDRMHEGAPNPQLEPHRAPGGQRECASFQRDGGPLRLRARHERYRHMR